MHKIIARTYLARSSNLRQLASKISLVLAAVPYEPYTKKPLWTLIPPSLRKDVVEYLPKTMVYFTPTLRVPGKYTASKDLIELRAEGTPLDKGVILHEVIHALDYARGARRQKEIDYFNSAIEINAYFEQGFAAFEDHIRKKLRSSRDLEWDKMTLLSADADMLDRTLNTWFHRDWVQALTPLNRRQVLKRLYVSIESLRDSLT